jgi:alcohol dehydrogenase class IV
MSNFAFATASRIIFGEGMRKRISELAREFGTRALIVTGKNSERSAWLAADLREHGIECSIFSVSGEPTTDSVEAGAKTARTANAEIVIAVGGGSAIDAGKAIAALATNRGSTVDYLEVIGKALPLAVDPLPFIAVPTTAGTGAEVTRNSVLCSKEHQLKVSLRSPKMLAAAAVVDPELTYGVPSDVTAHTGLDALTQLIEPFLCTNANAVTDALCREALPRVARSLPIAFRESRHVEARREMALGSLFGGLALANAGLGAVHGFAAPIGGMFDAPHGAICAALLPSAMAVNLRALQKRGDLRGTLKRFDELAKMLMGIAEARAGEVVEWVEKLCRELKAKRLRSFGLDTGNFEVLCERASRASSMKANPVELTRDELREILERSL